MSDKRRRAATNALKRSKLPEVNASKAGPVAGGAAGGGAPAGRALWFTAIALAVCGYMLLGKADAGGQNAWAIAAPALLLAGYLLFIPAIITTYRR